MFKKTCIIQLSAPSVLLDVTLKLKLRSPVSCLDQHLHFRDLCPFLVNSDITKPFIHDFHQSRLQSRDPCSDQSEKIFILKNSPLITCTLVGRGQVQQHTAHKDRSQF